MCKPPCCPGQNTGSGPGVTLAAVAGLALLSAAARPLLHAAEVIAQIVVITTAAVLAVALPAAAVAVVICARRARHPVTRPPAPIRLRTTRAVGPPAPTWAKAAIANRIRVLGPVSAGTGKPALLDRKLTEALADQHSITIVDAKQPGRWS